MPTDKLLELEGLTKYFYKPMGLLGRRQRIEQLARQFELALDFPTVTARPMKPRQHRPPQRGGR